jgi:arabinofuranosyltransferase
MKNINKYIYFILLAFLAIDIILVAWVSDDAFITFRVVDNFINGYGLRWNIQERVQAYTHPLWFFLISSISFIYNQPDLISIYLGILFSILAVYVIIKRFQNKPQFVLAIMGLYMSRAFSEYSTSGLENSLLFFLLAVYLLRFESMKISKLDFFINGFIVSLVLLTRLDHLLLVFPFMVYSLLRARSWVYYYYFILGLFPFFLWETFSLLYYGSLVPNTAIAKAFQGYSRLTKFQYGVNYFKDLSENNTIILIYTILGIILSLVQKSWKSKVYSLAIISHLFYILWVGGDFMRGRFMVTVLFISFIVILKVSLKKSFWFYSFYLALFVLFLFFFQKQNKEYISQNFQYYTNYNLSEYGIADERGWYYRYTGLLRKTNDSHVNHPRMKESKVQSKDLAIFGAIGFYGYNSPRELYIIDPIALTDPFLARLPAKPFQRVGHYYREIPEDYILSRMKDENSFKDRDMAKLYELVNFVTRGDLYNEERLGRIMDLVLFKYRN